jgi:galactokinase
MADNNWDIKSLTEEFINLHGGTKDDINIYFAPGRVNLIGEHTDYNGGYVFPCSLHYGTYLLVRIIYDSVIKLKSMNLPIVAELCVDKLMTPIGNTWVNYPLGVMHEFQIRKFSLPGMAMLYAGNIPNAAGLSSSASIEMVTAFALNDLGGFKFDMMDLIKLSQHAENEFVGMNCGIMDQFAVGMGKKDHAIFLNCDTLDYKLVPLVLGDYRLVITNTNKRRELAGSKYNERRMECERAVGNLNSVKPTRNLSELKLAEFNKLSGIIKNDVDRKRAGHVISENNRVLEAVESLQKKDLHKFGQLMIESHTSLKNDYEVSCFELDTLVEESLKVKGVLGSRMTGAGFGGCTVSLVHKDHTESFIKTVGEKYQKITHLEASFFIAEIGDGVRRVST